MASSRGKVRCEILYHRGIEQQESVPEDQDPRETLLLRICVRSAGSDLPAGSEEVQLHGLWAALLQSAGPGDLLELERVQEADDEEPDSRCFSVHGDQPAITVHREGYRYRLDKDTLEALKKKTLLLPEWLRLPPAKKAGKVYKYHSWLCTLRDGADANLWAVVWESSRQGPQFDKGWSRHAFVVVDPTFEHFPCAEWSTTDKLPLFSVTTSIEGQKVERLPHLTVGDVIRVHRARIAAKMPRFINIRQQSFSGMVAFPCPEELLEADAADADDAQVPHWGIQGETHTLVPADRARVRQLQAWVQQRLSKETMSQYLVMLRDLLESSSQRDLIVQVLQVESVPRLRLVVTDGSIPSISLDVSQPALAAKWLASDVKVGQWLRIQQVRSTGPGSEVLTVNAAHITKVPLWCLDVQVRRQQIEESGASYRAEDKAQLSPRPSISAPSGTAAAPSPAAQQRALARAARAQAPRESRSSGDTEMDEDEETPPVARETPRAARPEAPVAASLTAVTGRPKTQLSTIYVNTILPIRLADVHDAAARGERCMVLSNFTVARICDVSGADATSAQSLVATRCCCCGHTFAAPDQHVRAVKRQRKVWPCGHWLFRLQFRFKLALQQDEHLLWVFVADEFSGLLGETAEDVVGDSAARARAQKRLDALREDLSKPRMQELSNSMAVYRHDGPDTTVFGSYVVCDTSLELLPEN